MRPLATLPILALLITLVACSGGGPKRADTISAPTATPAVTASPGSSLAATPASTPAPSPTTAAQARSAADLQRVLLTLDDMPTGFTIDTPSSGTGSQPCGKSTELRARAAQTVEADFTKGGLGPFISETLGTYKSGEAKDAFDGARKLFEDCRTWTEPDKDGKTTEYKIAPLSFPKLGDQTYAIRMDIKGGGFVGQADLVFVRRGDTILLIGNGIGGLGLATVDSTLTEQMARKADENLASLK